MTHPADIAANLVAVHQRIEAACRACGRSSDSVTLVAVSKLVPEDAIRAAIAAGARHFGENRVQEAAGKIAALAGEAARSAPAGPAGIPGAGAAGAPLTWHLIGHLQSNKAGRAVELFDLIHSVDDADLVREIGRRAQRSGKAQAILLQVNCSGEMTKSGCRPEELVELARRAAATPGIVLRGLMTIGPLDPNPEATRAAFRRLRGLRDEAERALGADGAPAPGAGAAPLGAAGRPRGRLLPELSMGMTGDLEMAIEEGATLVRVGTAIFGERGGWR